MRKRLLQQFVFIVVLSLVWGQWPWSLGPQVAEAATGKMLLLWDPANGSVPSGWSYVSAADGRYLRGGSVAEAATTGGAATHSNTVSSFTVGNASAVEGASPLLGSGTFSNPTHTHAINWPGGGANEQSISSVINNNPAYRTLQLIAYNAGIPNVIPQNAIALFDSSPGILPGWSAYSSQNSRLVKIGNTVTTGGSDTHSATITWPSLGAPSGTQTASTLLAGGGNTYAPTSHTHAAPTSTTYSGLSSLPPYVEPVLGRLNSATTTLPGGFMALFDGDPGQGWNIKSNSGGTFYHQFLRPASSYNGTSQGNATETLNGGSPVVATTGGASSSNGTNGTRVAAGGHTHSFTATFAPTDIQPPYYNVVVAKKLGFSLSSFRWYDNSGSQDVTSPWGEPDFGQNASIKPIPVANNAISKRSSLSYT